MIGFVDLKNVLYKQYIDIMLAFNRIYIVITNL